MPSKPSTSSKKRKQQPAADPPPSQGKVSKTKQPPPPPPSPPPPEPEPPEPEPEPPEPEPAPDPRGSPKALHKEQKALVSRVKEEMASDTSKRICVEAPPGFGKTRVAGAIMQQHVHHTQNECSHDIKLAIYVAASPKLAREHAVEVGSMYGVPFNNGHFKGLKTKLEKKKSGDPPIVIVMTPIVFAKFVTSGFVVSFLTPLGNPAVHILLDEAHTYWKKSSKTATAMGSLHKAGVAMRITGMTTPLFENATCKKRAASVLGANPKEGVVVVKATEAEITAFRADMVPHAPTTAAKWTPSQLGAPTSLRYEGELKALGTIVVGITARPKASGEGEDQVEITDYTARNKIIWAVTAEQVHGHDDTGGQLFALIKGGEDGKIVWKVVQPDHSVKDMRRPPVFLLAHKADAGNVRHLQLLKKLEAAAPDGVKNFIVHDLRNKDLAEFNEAHRNFVSDVRTKTNHMVIGVVDKKQTFGSNHYAKNVSAIVAVGDWSAGELTQLKGRLARPCEQKVGDHFPEAHTFVHFKSRWAESVKEIGRASHDPYNVKVPDSFYAENKYDESEEKILKQLLDGGERLYDSKADENKRADLAKQFAHSCSDPQKFDDEFDKAVKEGKELSFQDDSEDESDDKDNDTGGPSGGK